MPAGQRAEIADLLHSASLHVLLRAAERDAESGLSAARLSALSVVVFRGPLTLGKLAATQGVRSATMTGIVNGLERDRLARRRPHENDRRAVVVAATAKGRRLLERARTHRIERVATGLADLSKDELELVRRAAELVDERFALRPWRPVGG